MKNNKIKTILIISIALNIAFLAGFMAKRTISCLSEEDEYKDHSYYYRHHKVHSENGVLNHAADRFRMHIHRKFGENPNIKKKFNEYLNKFYEIQEDIFDTKSALLEELKKDNHDIDKINKLQEKSNRLLTQLNKENLAHFMSLKKEMNTEEFKKLVDKLNSKLCKYHDTCKNWGKNIKTQNNKGSRKRQGGE